MKKRKKHIVVFQVIIMVILSIVFGALVYSWNVKTLVGNQMPMAFGYGAAVVLSGSMEPALEVDDVVIIKEKPSYQVGEVVVYQQYNVLIVHRIVALGGEVVVTQGDANAACDEPISKTAIKGAVVGKIPKFGVVVSVVQSFVGKVVIIVIALLLLILSYRKDKKNDDEQLQAIKEEIQKLKLKTGEDGVIDEKPQDEEKSS